MLKKLLAFGVLSAALLGAAAAGASAALTLAPRDGVLPAGLRIAGLPVGGDLRAFVGDRSAALVGRKVSFVLPKQGDKPERVVLSATLADLGVSVDTARTVRLAESTATVGGLLERLETKARADRGAIDVPLAIAFDRARAMSLLADTKESEDIVPTSARLDLAGRTVVPERKGQYLDANAAADATYLLARALARGDERAELRVELATQSFPARMTTDYVRSVDVSQVLSEFETYFSRSGDQARRAKNIEVAASKLDGLILAPGELVSFNQIVGDRSPENGFEKSWEIFKGEMKEGVGGGTCQVASTFHAAALFAGIEILERLPHSRPSAYIPLGLDATVVYPVVDMKMRNPYSFPVALHTSVDKNKLKVEVLGPRKPGKVSFSREILETLPFDRKIEEDASLPPDKVVVKQHGIRGFRIKRTRELVTESGERRVETTRDFYPPTLEIFKVSPSFDLAKLPPLPGEAAESAPAAEATPTPSATAAATAPSASTNAPEFKMVDGPGAHAPTKKQATPDKTLTLRR